MEQFLTYFPSAFSWGNLAVLILGSAGGLFFGAMPGLSPTMAVALLVPFTFYLPADTSLILLGAVYTSAVAGGSISAILLSIPGAPSSIATLFDAWPAANVHAVLVARDGRLAYEHYRTGDDNVWAGRSAPSASTRPHRTTCDRSPRASSPSPSAPPPRPMRRSTSTDRCSISSPNTPISPRPTSAPSGSAIC